MAAQFNPSGRIDIHDHLIVDEFSFHVVMPVKIGHRLAACYNACEGLADPEKDVAELVAACRSLLPKPHTGPVSDARDLEFWRSELEQGRDCQYIIDAYAAIAKFAKVKS